MLDDLEALLKLWRRWFIPEAVLALLIAAASYWLAFSVWALYLSLFSYGFGLLIGIRMPKEKKRHAV